METSANDAEVFQYELEDVQEIAREAGTTGRNSKKKSFAERHEIPEACREEVGAIKDDSHDCERQIKFVTLGHDFQVREDVSICG